MAQIIVSPDDLRFTQDSIKNRFRAPYHSLRIDDAVDQIRKKLLSPDNFPALNVVKHGGILWSLDNRRLWVFRKARVTVIKVNLVSVNCSPRSAEFFRDLDPWLERRYSDPAYYPRVRGHIRVIAVENVAKRPPQQFHAAEIGRRDAESPADILRPLLEKSTGDRAQKTAAAAPKLTYDHVIDIREFNETERRPLMDGSSKSNSQGTVGVSEPLSNVNNTIVTAKCPQVRVAGSGKLDMEGGDHGRAASPVSGGSTLWGMLQIAIGMAWTKIRGFLRFVVHSFI